MDDYVHHRIAPKTTAYGIVTTLKETYENYSPIKKEMDLRRCVYLKYTNTSPMSIYRNVIKGIVNLLIQTNTTLTNELHDC